MATNYLKPQEPLHKINKETGDINYIYPLVTDDQVIMEDGKRLNVAFGQFKAEATPVKGVDYFTESDKEEMVQAVLEALPVAEGVEF